MLRLVVFSGFGDYKSDCIAHPAIVLNYLQAAFRSAPRTDGAAMRGGARIVESAALLAMTVLAVALIAKHRGNSPMSCGPGNDPCRHGSFAHAWGHSWAVWLLVTERLVARDEPPPGPGFV